MSKIRFESKSQRGDGSVGTYYDVFNMSKIRFESKSQRLTEEETKNLGCFQYVKDTL